jgi:hypothetical protein
MNMNNRAQTSARLRPADYWRLWLFDTLLVSAGMHFFLATQYGTYEFFQHACAMAVLPLIPALVLVGGAGSTIFALNKVWLDKRMLPRTSAVTLLVGPAVVITLALVLFGATKSPASRLSYICLGNPPASVSRVEVVGYSSFLQEELLAVFSVEEPAFQTMVARSKLVPVDEVEFKRVQERSSLKTSKLFQTIPAAVQLRWFKRRFNEPEEHQRGSVYAVYDVATRTAAVFRGYQD